MDCSGNLDLTDAVMLLYHVFGLIDDFPCFVESTPTPTRDYAPNTSQGEVTASTWDFGDGQTNSEPAPTHVYETPGTYSVSLTVDGPGGSDTLTQTDLIDVLHENHPPVMTITSPTEDAVVAAGDVVVTGTITGSAFTATISLTDGTGLIAVMAEDDGGDTAFAGQLVQVDGEGPIIGIQAPERGQSVYTLTPAIEITYSDFASEVDLTTLQVTLTDEHGTSTDVTGDLTVDSAGASGILGASLTDDTRYTLSVSLGDTLGNVSQSLSAFYVPIDPANLTPPDEPEGAGWLVGTVYDSTKCTEHLQGCDPLPGAYVTLTKAGSGFPGTGPGGAIAGTIIIGPDGFFAFPVAETNTYWLHAEHDAYTYAQREVEVVRHLGNLRL